MRIFGGVNIARFMEEDLPIEHPWINKAIANAQKKVEGHNYDIRKHLLEYDDVMNQQRKVVYAWRREVLARGNLREMVFSMADELSGAIAEDFFPGGKLRRVNGQPHLDTRELNDALQVMFAIQAGLDERDISPFTGAGLKRKILELSEAAYSAKERELGDENIRQIEKMVLLSTIDHLWKDHLLAMDHLREGVGLQGYGQKDPLIVYKKEGFRFFEMMMGQITGDVIRKLFSVQLAPQEDLPLEDFAQDRQAPQMQYNLTEDGELVPSAASPEPARPKFDAEAALRSQAPRQMSLSRGGGAGDLLAGVAPAPAAAAVGAVSGDGYKAGRNDPCPCGSGKKFKKCHG
jgi:preprotein translocase subunit SecA